MFNEETRMTKRSIALLCLMAQLVLFTCTAFASNGLPKYETKQYRVSYYPYDCFNMQDSDGRKYGYGYDMMQDISKFMQCTFTYVGFDKTAKENEEMLRNGEIDIYTAAKKTPEREKEFAFSTHPAITATTCMNVKVGNTDIVAGDYSTYEGIRIGLLRRHTYNDRFEGWARSKGFSHSIVYYDTPAELTNALINGDVDAIINSYIGTPEDERIIEQFEETPYYLMARKEDQALLDDIDHAIDAMNVETPNWRTDLYNEYYGAPSKNSDFTTEEQAYLNTLKNMGCTIRAVMNPEGAPYSWYDENGNAHGIAADIFSVTAQRLGLNYEIVPVSDVYEYGNLLADGSIDVWLNASPYYDGQSDVIYKITDPYMTTSVSLLQRSDSINQPQKIAVLSSNYTIEGVTEAHWPSAEVVYEDALDQCVEAVLSGKVDAALLKTYTAQQLAQQDNLNRLRTTIVPGSTVQLYMGVNAADNYLFYDLWDKALTEVSAQYVDETIQQNLNTTNDITLVRYLYTNPEIFSVVLIIGVLALLFFALYLQSVHNNRKQKKISDELEKALAEAKQANDAKLNFFSKMSHDIRTPLNVVLGMTQVAQKYKNDTPRLENALENIATEGRYLLTLINSILDVNQLEHGRVELVQEPFSPAACLKECADSLRLLAEKKDQTLTVECDQKDRVVLGDVSRVSQIALNIISNAIKYTPAGGHIHLRLDTLPGDCYRFTCADDGIGMSEEFIRHIGEEYTRAEDSRISKTEGTGLGMAVVKGFVKRMGGTLNVRSKLGEGSTFIIELPLPPASEAQRKAVLSPAPEEMDNSRYQGRHVLLVEDNTLNAEIATELLKTIGFEVDWAADGKAGVEKFEQSAPGWYFAIFMDMQMPVMDGTEAARYIRASSRSDHAVPIFAMTANTFSSDRELCRKAGMDGYISKPVSLQDIETAIRDIK